MIGTLTGGNEGKTGSTFHALLPFSYLGPGGRLALGDRFELLVPAQAVRRFGLVDGDLVEVTIRADSRVHLRVATGVPRSVHLGLVRKGPTGVAPSGEILKGSAGLWEVVKEGRPVGWISEDEALHRGLADGDLVRVIGPAKEGADDPVASPATPDRSRLPRVRVLKHFESGGKREP